MRFKESKESLKSAFPTVKNNTKIILTKKTNDSKLYNWYIKVYDTLMLM